MAITAADVARGVCRLFAQAGLVAIPEVPLPNGRRTDLTAIDAKGQIVIVEIKVSRADLHGDGKWPDYCDWCDRFYWALASGLDPAILETEGYRPETSGLIIADRYDAAVVREAASCNLAPHAARPNCCASAGWRCGGRCWRPTPNSRRVGSRVRAYRL